MRVIEQARLAFREGTSDKVYEVDLVEVAPNQYVVNFRFGRRGSALRDGTKTASPLPLAKARSIFQKLVAEKTAGGYRPIGTGRDDGDDDEDEDDDEHGPNGSAGPSDLVARLRQGHRGEGPLGPVIWKVSDRDLREAEPALLELIDSRTPAPAERAAGGQQRLSPNQWLHTVVGALVRCGTTASLRRLGDIAGDVLQARHVRDVAHLAIGQIDRARAVALARKMLSAPCAAAYDRRDAGGLARAAEELLISNPAAAHDVAVALYLIDDDVARPAVLAMARVARLSNPEATTARALFRLAELRRDGELYALLARRIDAHTGYRPFGVRTRQYFRRRVARVLRRLGRAGSPDYVAMASAILRSYSDEDAQAASRGKVSGDHYDRWARYHALNETIYGKSPRYERGHHERSVWRCKGNYRPGQPAPAQREERFPELWDRAPGALWALFSARATPVVEFATRAMRAHPGFVDALPDDAVAAVLADGHPLAQQVVYDLVKGRPMSTALARGALASQITEAHVWVLLWIASHPDEVIRDAEMIALLVTGRTTAVRDAAIALLGSRTLADEVARSAAARSLSILLGLAAGSEDHASGAVATLLRVLAAPLRDVAADVLRDLVAHPLAALGELAGELMLRHARRDTLPHDLLESLLASPHPSVRLLGGRLLATTPADVAKDDLDALELFVLSANRELREGTRGLIAQVARAYPEVARALADRLVDALLKPQPDGVPAHVVSLLRGELAATLPSKPAATILRLIGALSPHAREAGGLLLHQVVPDEIGLDDIARLASHEVLSIREGAWALARASVGRYRMAPVAVSRLVDSPWEDTRNFATTLIRDELGDKLGADAIIAICDSIRPEVQALGKALLQEKFTTADAGRYLVRLAEHPSTNLQLLVSGLLEHHVGADLDRLRAMAPYLITVLSQVNRGRIAKQRVMMLVRREASRTAEGAALLAPLLDRQSATIAITQKHPLIAAMVEVHHAFPEQQLPITVIPPRPPDPREGAT